MRSSLDLVMQQKRFAFAVYDKQVELPVVIVIPDCEAPTNDVPCEVRSCLPAHLFKSDASILVAAGIMKELR